MAHKISPSDSNNKSITQSVLQASDMLALYHAELARILHLHCSDIGNLASGKELIEKDSLAYE